MAKKKRNVPEKHEAPLAEQIEDFQTYGDKAKSRVKKAKRANWRAEVDNAVETAGLDDVGPALSGAMSERIIREARAQREEVEADDNPAAAGPSERLPGPPGGRRQPYVPVAVDSDSDSDGGLDGGGSEWEEELEEVSPDDAAALAAFMGGAGADFRQRTLADAILDRIKEQQRDPAAERSGDDTAGPVPEGLQPQVVEVYRTLGKLLQRYSSGRVPKALKIIPGCTNWEELLFLTEPDLWSAHATHQATRIFVSNLNAKMAQRFLNLVLLPAVRNDIRDNKRLHFALFQALRKATYKPGSFYKGMLLPLCASGSCTLREAVIFSSVLRRTTIPVLHSAAALLRLADMEYNGINSFFIRVLLDKKYALPYRVIDALVDHFTSFKAEARQLPVVWHQSLLVFVQRYKHEIRAEDKEALRALLKVQHHYKVSPEVYRELDASRSRGDPQSLGLTTVKPKAGVRFTEDLRSLAPIEVMEEY